MGDTLVLSVSLSIALLSLIVAVTDYRTRRIHNWNVLLIALTSISGHVLLSAWPDLIFRLILALGAMVILFPLYTMGGLGAGDVKYLAAVSIWLGFNKLLVALLIGNLAFLAFVLLFLLVRGELNTYLQTMFIRATMGVQEFLKPTNDRIRLPYGVFLAFGVIVVLFWG